MRKERIIETIKVVSEAIPIVDRGYTIVSHPLINSTVTLDEKNNFVILDTEEKKKWALNRIYGILEKSENVHRIFLFINSPYRLQILSLIKNDVSKKEYNELLRESWILTEFPHQMGTRVLVEMFKLAEKNLLMTKEELNILKNLPKEVVIYRGTQSKKAKVNGLSWTLDKEKAEWFSKRFKLGGKIYQAKIDKEDIFMFNDERSEKEVVINSFKLKEVIEC